jgi:CubicO group peptidase (beta-lactamase class C family)
MTRALHGPRRRWLGLLLLLALVAGPGARGDAAPLPQALSDIVAARMDRDGVPGVVVTLIEDGRATWTGAFGLADPEARRPMTPDAVFRGESVSKPVTAWAAMVLAEAGRLDLDAPASDCLTRWRPPPGTPSFTARQLLSQTAGLGLGDFAARYPPGGDRPDLPTHIAQDFAMIGPPGARFAYSDTGFNLLELMIEDCAGEDFATFAAREIFAPLGMVTATYDWPGPGMPVGHDLRGFPVAPYVYPGRGSGGLFASAADIARLAEASLLPEAQTVLSAGAVGMLHQPAARVGGLFGLAADGYALGHFTETLSDGRAAVWHGGQGYGWMTHLHLVPETGDGIVILANSQRAWPLFADVLRAWSEGIGAAPVGMSRVLWAERIAWGLMCLLSAMSVVALAARRRCRGNRRAVRAMAGLAALPLVGWPLWAATQDYLFLFSILPRLWPWLALVFVVAGVSLLAFAFQRRAGR